MPEPSRLLPAQALALALTLALAAGGFAAAAQPTQAKRTSVLSRLAASVAERDAVVQADFAAIALDAVIAAYERELETLLTPGRRFSAAERAKQMRWARAASGLLDELYEARDGIDRGESVEVVAGVPAEVQVLVGERLLAVASPRIAHPEELENLVVGEFCELHSCAEFLSDAERGLVTAPDGGWSFRQGYGSTYVTPDGLGFMFRSIRDRPAKERVCRRAAAELREVAEVLKRARALGIDINWQGLEVLASRTGGGERLVVGFDGQGSRVSMPVLLRSPGVLQVAEPWLRARVGQQSVQQLFPRADLLFVKVLGRSG